MSSNSLLASAVQILCVAAYKGVGGTNAEQMAVSLKTNPVVVRRILKSLEKHGLVTIRHGRNGGVALKRSPREITLHDVNEAIGGGSQFALRPRGNPRCPVNQVMVAALPDVFAAADQAVADCLKSIRLEALTSKIGDAPSTQSGDRE